MRGTRLADGSYTRALDGEGRVVLPAQFRDQLGVLPGDVVRIIFDGQRVQIERAVLQCCECSTEDVVLEWSPDLWLCDRHVRSRMDEVESKLRGWAKHAS